ncbi:S-adenosyl-L-methionine-dependent methyltransferase [Globomyces pollinis-pini]|nr:S-adenosyl-L-methionine-dependent methyltransferase [Globomyces pollinis-pini]
MRQCLSHPLHGYYMNTDVFGTKGDFITSPEISQMFGELIAIWFIQYWQQMKSPKNIQIVEFGPGRGTLMHDLLYTIKQFPFIYKQIQSIHLVETSKHLGLLQREKLKPFHDQDIKFQWHERIDTIPNDTFTFYIGHEFFDALPIFQFQKTKDGWREIVVDIDDTQSSDLHFRNVLVPYKTKPLLLFEKQTQYEDAKIGDVIQICPDMWDLCCEISFRIAKNGGTGLFIDYGMEDIRTDRIRGIKDHKWVSPFSTPGKVDLSSDVEFSAIKHASLLSGANFVGPIKQGDFLKSMGIGARVMALMAGLKNEEERKQVIAAYERLTKPNEMGDIYQFCAITPKGIDSPYPFDVSN